MGDFDKAIFALARAIRRLAGASGVVASLQFTAPGLSPKEDAIVLYGLLRGAASEKATRVVATGVPVTIRYHARIVARTAGEPAWSASSAHVLRYDSLKNVYLVDRNGSVAPYRSAEDAVLAFSSYAVSFRGVDTTIPFDCQLEAFISYPSEHGDTSQALWGYMTPYLRVRDCNRLLGPPR
jgi:hypothetical protein